MAFCWYATIDQNCAINWPVVLLRMKFSESGDFMAENKTFKNRLQSSISVKLLVIALLLLILQIPQLLVRSIIDERQGMQYQAASEISQRWGGPQHIGAPLLNTQHTVVREVDGKSKQQTVHSLILPASLVVDAELDASERYLGMYEVPVFVAEVKMTGTIEFDARHHLGQVEDWQIQNLFIPIQSMRGLKGIKSVQINGHEVSLSQQQIAVNGSKGITLDLSAAALSHQPRQTLNFTIELSLAGSRNFSVLPMAGQTDINMRANWPAPSFKGDFLPAERHISDQGFDASWQVNELNHNLGRVISHVPSHHSGASERYGYSQPQTAWPDLGVEILIPADTYQVNERTIKYSLLIMVLTFAGFFLAEMFFKLRLHPFQYLLIGFSLTVFYLLLLSVSEYIRFDWAFALAALANVLLIGGYCSVVLGARQRGFYTGLLFAVLYGFIFVLVKAEQASLLMGAIGIWVFLALVMYLTRKIDWYAAGSSGP